MRLIDADELLKYFFRPYSNEEVYTNLDIKQIIDNVPTVVNEKLTSEKTQGEWIACTKSGMPLTENGRMAGEKRYGFKCSRCNFIYKGNALTDSPHCQICGAKMKGVMKNDSKRTRN